MQTNIRRFISLHWPITTLSILILLLFITNYIPGTYLTGWDNLHPEFNFSANIQRAIFAVWQEYQGLGLLGGMGHATDIVHAVFLFIVSFVLPQSILRYIWTFLMLWLGCIGMYVLLRRIVFQSQTQRLFPFLGALFYLLNLATIETFYAPFEAFTGHYAALPWLIFACLNYFQQKSKHSLALLVIILFLATPQAYIPTLFLVFILALSMYLLFWMLSSRSFPIIRLLKLYLIIIFVNAFWLLPFLYFVFTNSQVSISSKINQMSTPTIYAQNLEFGNLFDFAQLKGFWFNNVDYTRHNNFNYMLEPWRNYSNNPILIALSLLIFALVVFGLVMGLKKGKQQIWGFTGIFLLALIALANDTPPFSWINALIRNHISLLNEALRFPYTKFSILAAFIFAIFFALGIQAIYEWLKTTRQKQLLIVASIITLFIISLPMFTGNLIYTNEKTSIPQSYFQLFSYMRTQDPNTRIADMPQYTFWGWNFYNWPINGINQVDGGSGFIWYGIQQPILDRAFDVWSKYDENYYYELSQALYSQNPAAFNDVLQKYQINWLLWDKNIINPSSPQALFYPQFQQLLTQEPNVHLVKTFGNLELYKVALTDKPNSFVFSTPSDLPAVNLYTWSDNDVAYQKLGNYISVNHDSSVNLKSPVIDYPYRSLFSKKTSSDESFKVAQTSNSLIFKAIIPAHNQPLTLKIPSFISSQPIVPVIITSSPSAKTLNVDMKVSPPVVSLDNNNLWSSNSNLDFNISLSLPIPASQSGNPLEMKLNGVVNYPVSTTDKTVKTTFLSLEQKNILSIAKGSVVYANVVIPTSSIHIASAASSLIPATSQSQTLTVTYPKISDKYLSLIPDVSKGFTGSCDNFRNGNISIFPIKQPQADLRIQSKNATACTSYYSSTLSHRLGYIVFINSQNISGRGLHFWILNEDEKYAPLDTYLKGDKNQFETFILPPQDPFGQAYSLHFDNVSIGNQVATNQLNDVAMYTLPYNFLTNLVLQSSPYNKPVINNQVITSVNHTNPSSYTITTKNNQPFILALSQSYDQGWVAFANGKALNTHLELNNWENGWLITPVSNQSTQAITIIYLPQYLEYAGWICLAILLGIIGIKSLIKSH